MGSIATATSPTQSPGNTKPITVLVTGFGPFQDKFPVNPSFEITRSLPQILPQKTIDGRPIHVIGYGSPIRVSYEGARELIPPLLEGYAGTIDLVLHIGMASGRQFYAAERFAHGSGYDKHKDLDGKVFSDDEAFERFGDCPNKMTTSLDFDEVVRTWQELIKRGPEDSAAYGADCRPSYDAGHYLCDFTYYNSLVWYARRDLRPYEESKSSRPVLFFHVPAESTPEDLDRGVAVATALITAMADDLASASPSQ